MRLDWTLLIPIGLTTRFCVDVWTVVFSPLCLGRFSAVQLIVVLEDLVEATELDCYLGDVSSLIWTASRVHSFQNWTVYNITIKLMLVLFSIWNEFLICLRILGYKRFFTFSVFDNGTDTCCLSIWSSVWCEQCRSTKLILSFYFCE